jgi:hypothetical protein
MLMKKVPLSLIALLIAALCFTATSCEEVVDDIPIVDTPVDTVPDVIPSGPKSLAALIQWFDDEYGVQFRYQFVATDWEPVSSGRTFAYTSATDTTSIKKMLVYIENNVFSALTKPVVSRYMPTKILLVDSLILPYVYSDLLSSPSVEWTENRALPGNVTGDYLVLGNVAPRLDTTSAQLRYDLISLFVERMLFTTSLPEPLELRDVTERIAATIGCGIFSSLGTKTLNYPYWDGTASFLGKHWLAGASEMPADPVAEGQRKTMWQGLGILNMGRIGDEEFDAELVLGIIAYVSWTPCKGTIRQDFADIAALIFTKTPAEREAIFSDIAANISCAYGTPSASAPWVTEDNRDTRFPYGGQEGANGLREKVALVKTYFRTHLELTLPE